jgi:hypothetical protein
MKFLLYFSLAAVVVGFSPVQHAKGDSTARSMGMLDDWKTFFSPEEIQHRKQDHEHEMEEMRAAQKEVLDRRRNPSKMNAYHQQEEKRHEEFDHKHDIDIEQELAKEWIVGEQPLINHAPKVAHSVFADLKNFLSMSEKEPELEMHDPKSPMKLASSLDKSMKTMLADFVPKKPVFEKVADLKRVQSNQPIKQGAGVKNGLEKALADVVSKKPVVDKGPELESDDISIPYDAPSALAYKFSDKSMVYSDFKLKYEADAVADVISKRRLIEKEPEVVTIDISIPYNSPASLADEAGNKSTAYADFKLKYEADAAADITSKRAVDLSFPYGAPAEVVNDAHPARGDNLGVYSVLDGVAPARGKPELATNPTGDHLDTISSIFPSSSKALSASSLATTVTNPMGGYLDNMSGATTPSSSARSASPQVTTSKNPMGNNMRSATCTSSSAPSASSPAATTYLDSMRSSTPASSSPTSASSPVTTATNSTGGYLNNMSSATPVSSSAQSASSSVTTATNLIGAYVESMISATPTSSTVPSASKTATNQRDARLDNISGATPASSTSSSASFLAKTAANLMGGYLDKMSSATPPSSIAPSAASPSTTATVSRSSSVSTISNASSGEIESTGSADFRQKYKDDAVADVISKRSVIEKGSAVETADISVPYDMIQDLYVEVFSAW